MTDLDPGRPQYLVNVNGAVYFSAWDFREEELWRTDGTAEGTHFVRDIMDGGSCCYHGSAPRKLIAADDLLYFTAVDMQPDSNGGWHGRELWRSDGTDEGTFLVKDIRAGGLSSEPDHLTALGAKVVFAASDFTGQYLWVSDGLSNGAAALAAASGVTPSTHFAVVNDVVYFANDATGFGRELWRTDGTEDGTYMLMDIVPGEGWSYPSGMYRAGDKLFFAAYADGDSSELWVTNGTVAGTMMLRDFWPGYGSPNLFSLGAIELNEELLFSVSDGIHGIELWKSDGTAEGTVLLRDFKTDNFGSSPRQLAQVGEQLYFIANDGFATSLFVKSATHTDPVALMQLPANAPQYYLDAFNLIGDRLYFFRKNGSGELWRIDGTPEGTTQVVAVRLQGRPAAAVVGDRLLFSAVAVDGAVNLGVELWTRDGTEDGTKLVQDINPGARHAFQPSLRSRTLQIATSRTRALQVREHRRKHRDRCELPFS